MKQELNKNIKICPLCKVTFMCVPSQCWCSNLPEKLPVLENGDCYCPKCLESIIEKKAGTLI
jgi:hypothetical protein